MSRPHRSPPPSSLLFSPPPPYRTTPSSPNQAPRSPLQAPHSPLRAPHTPYRAPPPMLPTTATETSPLNSAKRLDGGRSRSQWVLCASIVLLFASTTLFLCIRFPLDEPAPHRPDPPRCSPEPVHPAPEAPKPEPEAPKYEVFWDMPLLPESDCLGYGSRVYSAKLNIYPLDEAWHNICMHDAPEVEVMGKVLEKPKWCDLRKNTRDVMGHWIVDFDEPECISSWGWMDDKGCTAEASGLRTYEATLYGHLDGGAWRDMCRRTAAIVHGTKFKGAMRCYHQEGQRVYGAWDLEDETCA
ncbi:uncharacterized protein SCHCODRAFT_02635786 [Schizophyllum commune H4-8]|uniref:Uncharacterized protein n=1 Tax=Schizophyllum commune (strain H4-8 / FGSC 9210) TaxID=578458 RepID=D8QEV3_SCHCM|nr:uncharacterized protein SCHCODRAFT_02635786 [Schizophyllum commune H4-8]KAI5888130.1 hypothetical protein SCHCODRAFT_02635786 [Schizophyllum commune H4-8]